MVEMIWQRTWCATLMEMYGLTSAHSSTAMNGPMRRPRMVRTASTPSTAAAVCLMALSASPSSPQSTSSVTLRRTPPTQPFAQPPRPLRCSWKCNDSGGRSLVEKA
jgi:hypothetical protein